MWIACLFLEDDTEPGAFGARLSPKPPEEANGVTS